MSHECELCPLWPGGGQCPLCFWGPMDHDLAARELKLAANSVTAELMHRQDPEWLAQRRLAMAVDLGLDLDTCKALLLGDRVPPNKLSKAAMMRYGLRL